jgi:linoleoyl-CoA desaturase
MRDRHIHNPKDSALLKLIYKEVDGQLLTDKYTFAVKICLKFVFYSMLTAFCYSTLYIVSDPAAFVLCFVAYGFTSMLFAFNFSHDFSHNTIFKSKAWNKRCFVFIYALVGAHAEAWKERHVNSHHYAPNVEGYDTDLKISKLIRVVPGSPHYWFHRFQHWYAPLAYTSYSLFWIFIKDFVILFGKDKHNEKKDFIYHLSFWAQKIFYLTVILILPFLFSNQSWFMVLAGFLFMHFIQSLFLLFTFFMTHHVEETEYPTTTQDGFINTSWLMNQIKSSNDIHPFSEIANFILGGFNNHIAHHLFPHYHHIYYPKLNLILYGILQRHNIIPNQTSYWGGIVSHLTLLKRMSVADCKNF